MKRKRKSRKKKSIKGGDNSKTHSNSKQLVIIISKRMFE